MDDVRRAAEERAKRPKTAPVGASFESERQRSKNALVKQLDSMDGRNVRKIAAVADAPQEEKMEDKQAVVIPAERVEQFEISGRALLKKIRHMVGWEDDLPRLCYGEYLPAHQAIRFDLTEAEPVELAE